MKVFTCACVLEKIHNLHNVYYTVGLPTIVLVLLKQSFDIFFTSNS